MHHLFTSLNPDKKTKKDEKYEKRGFTTKERRKQTEKDERRRKCTKKSNKLKNLTSEKKKKKDEQKNANKGEKRGTMTEYDKRRLRRTQKDGATYVCGLGYMVKTKTLLLFV